MCGIWNVYNGAHKMKKMSIAVMAVLAVSTLDLGAAPARVQPTTSLGVACVPIGQITTTAIAISYRFMSTRALPIILTR